MPGLLVFSAYCLLFFLPVVLVLPPCSSLPLPLPLRLPLPLLQACTEQVMPFASNASNSMFEPYEWDPQAFSDTCFEAYGVRPRPSWILTHFGGRVGASAGSQRLPACCRG